MRLTDCADAARALARRIRNLRAMPVLAALLIAAPADAEAGAGADIGAREWRVVGAESSILFDFEVNGVAGQGRFSRFSGAGIFDPARPEKSSLAMEIQIGGLTIGNPIGDAFVLGPDWFDLANHPLARFRLDDLRPAGGAGLAEKLGEAASTIAFMATGQLTLKGQTLPITVPLQLVIDGDDAHAVGAWDFEPLDYGVGDGPSALFAKVGERVRVSFDILARSAKP